MRWLFAVILCLIGMFALVISNPGSAILFILTAFYISPLRRKLWQKMRWKPLSRLRKLILLFVLLLASFLSLGVGGEFDTVSPEGSGMESSQGSESLEAVPDESQVESESSSELELESVSQPESESKPESVSQVESQVSAAKNAETAESSEESQQPRARTLEREYADLEVHYIDVGQGDATLLICDGETLLIDAGDNSQGTAVQSYLMSQGVDKLDYVIGTHPDEDHIGGLDVIITKFDCGTIFLTDSDKDTRTYEDVLDAIKYKRYTTTVPAVGDTYVLGTATMTFIAPNSTDYESENDGSIGILVENGDTRFLFTGDAEEAAEADILQNGIDISADVYKVAHHGSKTSTSEAFLEAVSPEYAVISCGEDNSYGHPHAAVLNSLRAAGVQVFRTDEQGSILCISDGRTLTWNCSPSETWQAGEPTGSAQEIQTAETAEAAESPTQDIVHITKTGTKYHRAGCSYLKSSDIEITREEAIAQGYEPCSRCNP